MTNHPNRSGTTQITALAEELQATGFQVKIWRSERIYLQQLGLGVDAIIQFDNPGRPARDCTSPLRYFAGCHLKVFSTDRQNENPQTDIEKSKFAKHSIMARMAAAGIIPGPVPLRWQDITL
jgi:hypothetical protein